MKRSFEESPFFTPLFLDGDVYEYEALTFYNDLETMRKQRITHSSELCCQALESSANCLCSCFLLFAKKSSLGRGMVGLHLAGTLWTCMNKIDFFFYVNIAGEQGSMNRVSGKVKSP